MRIFTIHSLILALEPAGDLDRHLSIFSKELGRIRVVAKGVRKITSRRGPHVDLFHHVRIEVEESSRRAASEGPRYLREVDIINAFPTLTRHPSRFAAACVIAGFLSRILPEGTPQTALFVLTCTTFKALDIGKKPRQILFTYFLKTLRLLGYLPPRLRKRDLRTLLWKTLHTVDPKLSLHARRTLGIFSSLESKRSN